MAKPLAFYGNLAESPYLFYLNGVTYYFSSELNLNKFKDKYEQNRAEVAARLHKRYRYAVECSQFADVYLYKEIENRGFYIKTESGDFVWPGQVKFAFQPLTKRT